MRVTVQELITASLRGKEAVRELMEAEDGHLAMNAHNLWLIERAAEDASGPWVRWDVLQSGNYSVNATPWVEVRE